MVRLGVMPLRCRPIFFVDEKKMEEKEYICKVKGDWSFGCELVYRKNE